MLKNISLIGKTKNTELVASFMSNDYLIELTPSRDDYRLETLNGKRYKWTFTISRDVNQNAFMVIELHSLRGQKEISTNIELWACFKERIGVETNEKPHVFTVSSMVIKLDLGFNFTQKTYNAIHCYIEIIDEVIPIDFKKEILRNSDFIQDIKELYYEDKTKDVIIKVSGKELRAHKIILTSRSPVFRRMFNAQMKESSTGIIEMFDFPYEVISSLIEFIYTNNCRKITNLEMTLRAADFYEMDGLKQLCASELFRQINFVNALDILIILDRYNEQDVKGFVVAFIFALKTEIFREEGTRLEFERSNPELAAELYKQIFP